MASPNDGAPSGGAPSGGGGPPQAKEPWTGPRKIAKPEDLAAAIKGVMATRGLTTREVVRRVPRRHVGTVYRLLAGRTTDPWASTVVSLCTALDADPDELLNVEDAISGLDPELRQTLADVEELAEDDRWLALDMLRAILARKLHGIERGSAATSVPVDAAVAAEA